MPIVHNSRIFHMVAIAFSAAAIGIAAVVGVQCFGGSSDTGAPISGSVRVAGSETMRAIVTTWAEDFMTRNFQIDVIVRGGGSGDGIAALLHGLVDIGMASRDLTARERDSAASQGIELAVTELALDGISIVVNRAVSVSALDIDQLRSVFEGKIRNWRQLGGDDTDILAFARAEGSGTAPQ